MIYLTADTHLGDPTIMKYVDRPFNNVEEMDRVLIENINNTVGGDDILYILGDFTVGRDFAKCIHYREQINCRHVRLILGNHDNRRAQCGDGQSSFEMRCDYYEIRYDLLLFCLSHYPIEFWNGRDYGSIMCHGHIHSNKRSNGINKWQGIRRYDVGVDANDYAPVSIDSIIYFFEHVDRMK